jgi:hypothetical protein
MTVATVAAAAAAASARSLAPCTFANGLQTGPSARHIPGGIVISLYVENTRGRSGCRFRAKVALSLREDATRLLLPVRGNFAPPRAVNTAVAKGAVLRISWLWRNWCRRVAAVGYVESMRDGADRQEWVGRLASPPCRDRRRPSTLAAYGLKILR